MRPGYANLITDKDEIRNVIYTNEAFANYGNVVNDAYKSWKNYAWPHLIGIDEKLEVKALVVDLARELLAQFESIHLLDKYDVYEVLLSYWNETMGDDVSMISVDEKGYSLARETENIMGTYTSGKKKGEEKVVGWDGKLIPKNIIIDYFFAAEREAISAAENVVAQTEAKLAEMIEDADEESIIMDIICEGKPISEAYAEDAEMLEQVLGLMTKVSEYNSLAKKLKKALDKKCREQYAKLTDEEIIELLVNRKWCLSIYAGIDGLYTAISHYLASRIITLVDRYEKTLPDLSASVDSLEGKVKNHLERMGFAW